MLIMAVCPKHPEWPLHSWQFGTDLADDNRCGKRMWQNRCGHRKLITHLRRGPRGVLVVKPMHGLMNRVRAMVSAKLVAEYSDRTLVVDWTRDVHCNASYESLFGNQPDVKVVNGNVNCDSTLTLVGSTDHNTVVKTVSVPATHTPCVVTAYKLISDVFDPYVHNVAYANALKQWKVSAAVERIVDELKVPNRFVAVHVRSVSSITKDVPDIQTAGATGIEAMDVGVLIAHRKACVWQAFLPAIQRLSAMGIPFWVASDTPDVADRFRAQLVASEVRGIKQPKDCFGTAQRAEPCQQFALATVKALMKATAFVGSTWSSYSEAIGDVVGVTTSGCRQDSTLTRKNEPSDAKLAVLVACRNRDTASEVIETALRSTVDQVVVVNWSSKTWNVSESNSKLTVVKAIEEPNWHLGRAYNLGMRFVTSDIVWKIDCDTRIDVNAVNEVATLTDGTFRTGDWRIGGNAAHLNGNLVVKRADFWAVGGYDERIQSYGWDDTSLYNRLNATGLKWLRIEPGWASHIEHSNAKRGSVNVHRSIHRNRLCNEAAVPWLNVEPSQYKVLTHLTVKSTFVPAEICVETSADLSTVDAIGLWAMINGNERCNGRFWNAVKKYACHTDAQQIAVLNDISGETMATAATECHAGNANACGAVAKRCGRAI